MPPMEQNFYVRLTQDQLFNNAYGSNILNTDAEYVGHYIPPSSLIIMTDTFSPRYWAHRRGVPQGQIVEHIPRLNALSDAVWQVWTRLTDQPGSLRYYAVEGIFNDVTSALIDYLLRRDRPRESLIVPWERRVTYGLDSDEGKALLATPNGIAVLWLLVHRRGTLGRRDPRVTIYDPGTSRRMIWEFIPPGGKSTFDDYRAANFTLPGSLRRRNLKPDLSPKISEGSHVKETLGLRWSHLVEKGKRYWEEGVLPALEGRFPFPTPQWTERDLVGDDILDTGWAWKDEPEENLPDHWKDVFELIPEGNKAGRNDDTTLVSLDHNGAFTNIRGDTDV
ncbi:MAG: hypothetical protein Q9199_005682, partial [Rusavskia elegans]